MTTAAKNKLSQCRTRDALYNVLAIECEQLGYDYDLSRSFRYNAGKARDSMRFGVAEIINWAERVESGL